MPMVIPEVGFVVHCITTSTATYAAVMNRRTNAFEHSKSIIQSGSVKQPAAMTMLAASGSQCKYIDIGIYTLVYCNNSIHKIHIATMVLILGDWITLVWPDDRVLKFDCSRRCRAVCSLIVAST